jgi:hypothetical protein
MLKIFFLAITFLFMGCSSATISNSQGGPKGVTSDHTEKMQLKSSKTITIKCTGKNEYIVGKNKYILVGDKLILAKEETK